MTELLIIFGLLLANGFFAMSEIAIISTRKARLKTLFESGQTKAGVALSLAENPNPFLATVQVGITLIGIFAGVFGGATIAEHLNLVLMTVPAIAPYSQAFSLGIVVIGITYCSLVIGELLPKRIALSNPERIAIFVAPFMHFLSRVASPAVWMLERSTDFFIRILGLKTAAEALVTPEEIRILIEQGKEDGAFEEAEQYMIENVLQLDDCLINAVMTPRPRIIYFDVADTLEIIQKKMTDCHHSRFPVIQDTFDNVLGMVYAKDLLMQMLLHKPLNLRELLRPAIFIAETTSALKVLDVFKEKKTHIALVTDEYGIIQGLITHNDILEDIVGNLSSFGSPQAFKREDGSWLVDGLFEIGKLKELLSLSTLPYESERRYYTLGGFMLSQFHSVPSVGQYFEWQNFRFEVVDMDGRRVDQVLIRPIDPIVMPS